MTEDTKATKYTELWATIDDSSIKIVEPNYTIQISNPSGKILLLDFNGDKLVTSGNLPLDEAARTMFELMFQYWKEAKIDG